MTYFIDFYYFFDAAKINIFFHKTNIFCIFCDFFLFCPSKKTA